MVLVKIIINSYVWLSTYESVACSVLLVQSEYSQVLESKYRKQSSPVRRPIFQYSLQGQIPCKLKIIWIFANIKSGKHRATDLGVREQFREAQVPC